MDEHQFFDYHNLHWRFTLSDGSTVTGVAFQYSFEGPPAKDYYFVGSNDLLEFRDAQLIGDKERCRQLATFFDLSKVTKAEHLS